PTRSTARTPPPAPRRSPTTPSTACTPSSSAAPRPGSRWTAPPATPGRASRPLASCPARPPSSTPPPRSSAMHAYTPRSVNVDELDAPECARCGCGILASDYYGSGLCAECADAEADVQSLLAYVEARRDLHP